MSTFDRLLDDLAQETSELDRLLGGEWDEATRDHVRHLAYFDEVAVLALVDRRRFRAEVVRPGVLGPMSDVDLRAWFDLVRADLLLGLTITDPGRQVPWYGTDMDAQTVATARLAETWAHGQDLGGLAAPTARLRHVADLGVCAFGATFRRRGLKMPVEPVFVELAGPGGVWTWGPPDAVERVLGSAVEFCQVVARRKGVAETGLVVTGPVAARWLAIADTFACPGVRRVGALAG